MSTASLRKDHDLIEKVLKSMNATLELLASGKKIPESILMPVVDFSRNFVDVCHHGKEEDGLFPALYEKGMPREMGPIAMMVMEHKMTKEIAEKIEKSSRKYIETEESEQLISDIREYIEHVSQHLWKENNRLFMMADMALQGDSSKMDDVLSKTEESKLQELGKTREHYEKLADQLEESTK